MTYLDKIRAKEFRVNRVIQDGKPFIGIFPKGDLTDAQRKYIANHRDAILAELEAEITAPPTPKQIAEAQGWLDKLPEDTRLIGRELPPVNCEWLIEFLSDTDRREYENRFGLAWGRWHNALAKVKSDVAS